jgi:hypothetical protein
MDRQLSIYVLRNTQYINDTEMAQAQGGYRKNKTGKAEFKYRLQYRNDSVRHLSGNSKTLL